MYRRLSDVVESQNNGERSARIDRIREELRRVIEREYALCGKYQALAASFRSLMPDENLRHDAVLQALSATLKQGRDKILADLREQHEELALLEEEAAVLFAGLLPENGSLLQPKPAAAAAEPASYPHCPKCGERVFERDETGWKCHSCSYAEMVGSAAAPAALEPQPEAGETTGEKKCPRCAGQMHFHAHDGHWLCYTCSHEEVPGHAGKKSTTEAAPSQAAAPKPASAPSFAVPLAAMVTHGPGARHAGASAARAVEKKRTCLVCRKKMDWHEHEKIWRCFYCGHKTW